MNHNRIEPPDPNDDGLGLLRGLRNILRWYLWCVAIGLLIWCLAGCTTITHEPCDAALIVSSCPALSTDAPADFGATTLLLIDTSSTYNQCRHAALTCTTTEKHNVDAR